MTFENCTIQSLQGLCYSDGLTLRTCRLLDTTVFLHGRRGAPHPTTSPNHQQGKDSSNDPQ